MSIGVSFSLRYWFTFLYKVLCVYQNLSIISKISEQICIFLEKILWLKQWTMSPLPLEGLQGPAGYLPSAQEGPRGGSISLSMLIDFIIQRTYHDLTVLAELYALMFTHFDRWLDKFSKFFSIRLPRKTDMERKIEIYNFSARTRQLFIRLLALVKWANSASKVDKSAVSC